MAQDIKLRDRVRFLPGLKKKDLPPMFDSTFVGTVYMSLIDSWLPTSFSNWQEDKWFNYDSIIGMRDNGGSYINTSVSPSLISEIDWNIFQYGSEGNPLFVINPSVRNEYGFYYNENVKEDGSHSGFVFYTVYDLQITQDTTSGKGRYSLAVDIWESKVLFNDASTYEEIN
jgi:hypothetical protein